MTIDELLNLDYGDIRKLSREEAQRLYSDVKRNVTRRSNRLEKAGVFSPALANLQNRGTLKPSKGMTVNELKSGIQSGLTFLRAKTSTVKGAKESAEKIEDLITVQGVELTEAQAKRMWRVYAKMQRNGLSREQMREIMGGSDKVIRAIASVIRNNPGMRKFDDIIARAEELLEKEGETIEADTTSEMVRLARDEDF